MSVIRELCLNLCIQLQSKTILPANILLQRTAVEFPRSFMLRGPRRLGYRVKRQQGTMLSALYRCGIVRLEIARKIPSHHRVEYSSAQHLMPAELRQRQHRRRAGDQFANVRDVVLQSQSEIIFSEKPLEHLAAGGAGSIERAGGIMVFQQDDRQWLRGRPAKNAGAPGCVVDAFLRATIDNPSSARALVLRIREGDRSVSIVDKAHGARRMRHPMRTDGGEGDDGALRPRAPLPAIVTHVFSSSAVMGRPDAATNRTRL